MKKSPSPSPPPASFTGKKKKSHAPAHNTALNSQNRRVLAQHYRAKYGVK